MRILILSYNNIVKIEGIGLKTALRIIEELGINTIDQLETATKQGRLSKLKGFGPRKEENILLELPNNSCHHKDLDKLKLQKKGFRF